MSRGIAFVTSFCLSLGVVLVPTAALAVPPPEIPKDLTEFCATHELPCDSESEIVAALTPNEGAAEATYTSRPGFVLDGEDAGIYGGLEIGEVPLYHDEPCHELEVKKEYRDNTGQVLLYTVGLSIAWCSNGTSSEATKIVDYLADPFFIAGAPGFILTDTTEVQLGGRGDYSIASHVDFVVEYCLVPVFALGCLGPLRREPWISTTVNAAGGYNYSSGEN